MGEVHVWVISARLLIWNTTTKILPLNGVIEETWRDKLQTASVKAARPGVWIDNKVDYAVSGCQAGLWNSKCRAGRPGRHLLNRHSVCHFPHLEVWANRRAEGLWAWVTRLVRADHRRAGKLLLDNGAGVFCGVLVNYREIWLVFIVHCNYFLQKKCLS